MRLPKVANSAQSPQFTTATAAATTRTTAAATTATTTTTPINAFEQLMS